MRSTRTLVRSRIVPCVDFGERPAAEPERRADGLAVVAAVVLCFVLLLCGSPVSADEDDLLLEQFLARLGLDDLQTLHLRQQLERESAADAQLAIARRLADLYAERLLVLGENPEGAARVMEQLEELSQRYPAARTDALEIVLLQADFLRAERQVNQWLADATQQQAREEAAAILARVAPLLERRQREITLRAERALEALDAAPRDADYQVKEERWLRLESVAARALYFAATANYYWALVDRAGTAGFRQARELFRKVLAIEEDYAQILPGSLNLESIWMSRAVVGLALSEAALGNRAASDICFAWLEQGAAPREVQDQLPYWRLRALLQTGSLGDAVALAQRQVSSLSGTATPAKVSFCVNLVQSGFGAATPDPRLSQLGILGIAGLMKLRQQGAVQQLIEGYELSFEGGSGLEAFYRKWIRGELLFADAETSKQRDDYEQAARWLGGALQEPSSDQDLAAAAWCRQRLAWCHYRIGEREEAARLFEEAAAGLAAAADPLAVEAAWMAFVAYQALSKEEPRFVSSAAAVLNQIQRDYPRHPLARRAAYYLTRLTAEASTPTETLARLERVSPGSDSYLAARLDICALWKEIWAQREGPARREAFAALQDAAEVLLSASVRADPLQVRGCLLVVDAALESVPPQARVAEAQLARAASLLEELPGEARLAAEYHYRALRLAQVNGDDAASATHAAWLAENARGSDYEVVALVQAAKSADAALNVSNAFDRQRAVAAAYGYYSRLAQLLGTSAQQLAGNRNARVACSKAADYASALGKHAEAAILLDQLLASSQIKNRGDLRRAGLAHFRAGHYRESLGHWRTLLSGLPRGSNDWYEAKYYQLACLKQFDEVRFREAAGQFRLLDPQLGSELWRPQFTELLGDAG